MNIVIYGIHVIQSLLEHDPKCFLEVYFYRESRNRRLHSLIQQLEKIGIIIQMVDHQWLDKKVGNVVHQGIIARVRIKQQYQEQDLPVLIAQQKSLLLLVLDSITDPHNLGACLRCADATGVHAVIVPRNRSVRLNAIVKKVASGADITVPLIRVTNLVRTLKFLQQQQVWIIGTAEEADHHIYQSKMTGSLALVMGAEDNGIRHSTRKYCDEIIYIPMAGKVPSLNISVAAGVCLFEVVRQRNKINI